MRKSRFSETQIVGILRDAESGVPVPDLLRTHGVSKATFFKWRSKYGGASVSDVRQLRELEAEHAKLKRVDPIRRKLLKTGAAAAAMAATPPALFARQSGNDDSGRFYERGNVRIRYEETGSGFPLLLISGGGLNGSTIAGIRRGNPFSTIEAFSGEFRCIYADLRHAAGQSTGPLEVDRPWDAYTDDHLGLMDHLGIDRFMVLGFCIAGPFIWNLIKRAPDRVVAVVPAQPVGFRPELPNAMYESQSNSWGAEVVKRRPDITTQMADQFLNRLFRTNPDFVFTVTRDFVRQCQTPVLVLPDDTTGHSYDAAIESAMLAPNGQLSMYPWKDTPEKIPLAVRHVRSFLLSYRPA